MDLLKENMGSSKRFSLVYSVFVEVCSSEVLFANGVDSGLWSCLRETFATILDWSQARSGLFRELCSALFDNGIKSAEFRQILFTEFGDTVIAMCVFGPSLQKPQEEKVNGAIGVKLIKEGGIAVFDDDGVINVDDLEAMKEYEQSCLTLLQYFGMELWRQRLPCPSSREFSFASEHGHER